jgi:hypothetical protein
MMTVKWVDPYVDITVWGATGGWVRTQCDSLCGEHRFSDPGGLGQPKVLLRIL